MFGKNKKKRINTESIKKFNEAKKAINFFIDVEEWDNAYNAIEEVKKKEKQAYEILIKNIDKEISSGIGEVDLAVKEKEKQLNTFNKNSEELEKLKKMTEVKEQKSKAKLEKERFKIRFKTIKDEINILTKTNKNTEAMNLLSKFLEENKENPLIIRFYNSQKKYIQKNIEKQKKREESQLKKDAKLEALKLIGEKNTEKDKEEKEKKVGKIMIFEKLKESVNIYKNIKERLRRKRLLDEVSILIEEDSKAKKDIAEKKLENIHRGLIKELNSDNINGYNLYGKILGADKISGDTFGFYEAKERYNFFLGDATGHGIRAGFIVTLISRIFNKFVNKLNLQELCFEINNGLKQDLRNRNFITGIFFEIEKKDIGTIKYVGMGHEPMLIYRNETNSIEKIIPGGLAAGIRTIQDINTIKVKEMKVANGDIIMIYSDGVVETKNQLGEFYGIERLSKTFQKIAKIDKNVSKIYNYIIKDLKVFKSGTSFVDDTTILLLKRDGEKDLIDKDSDYLKDLTISEGLSRKEIKQLEGKNKDEIKAELEKIKKEKELKSIIKNLEGLYYTGEILKLKQEAIRFIKAGYIDKKINFFLKKAIDNETKYKIEQKNQKMQNKYNVLEELYKKGDYQTVIREAEEIIGKDGQV